jgi:DNA-binding beta-propeller fold protein YncE
MATVGSGDYKYEIVTSWPKMLRYWGFGGPSDAAVNSGDEIYVFSRGVHPVTIWDTDGNLISSWGEGDFDKGGAHGIFISPEDHVWLADMYEHVVTEHTPGGERLRELGMRMMPSPAWDARPFNMPTGVASAPGGDVVVSDGYGGHRVHRFGREGELKLSWGEPGGGPGQFALLHNVAVDGRGRVFVCDREGDRIQLFDDGGRYLEQWTDLSGPSDLWIRDDIVYVVEQLKRPGVSIWTLEGDLITRWRGESGPAKGVLTSSHGVCVDSQGSIYVTELGGDRVVKFQRV